MLVEQMVTMTVGNSVELMEVQLVGLKVAQKDEQTVDTSAEMMVGRMVDEME
jgi:hypothetical protein